MMDRGLSSTHGVSAAVLSERGRMMAKPTAEPVFVNLQNGVVQVFDESRRAVRIAPWGDRNRGQEAVFEVKGEHYRQFVSARGPLFPRPAGAESAAPSPDVDDAASKAKVSGNQAPGSDVGGKKAEESDPPEDLSGYTVEGAVEWIAATEAVVLLKKWSAADDRKGVKEAVEKRLVELAE